MDYTLVCLLCLLISLAPSGGKARNQETQRPNIIVIVADDLGWDDVSFHGSDQIPTPNIDALAQDGIILNNYYVQPICTPTRSALMTGRHPIHTGMQQGVIVGAQKYGLGLDEKLMPEYLKEAGYATHMVGKWHLGMFAKEYTPTYRGFESHYGYYQGCEDYLDHTYQAHGDKWGLDFRRNMTLVKDAFGEYSTELFTKETEKVINNHDTNKPLFLYLPHQAVHSGNTVTPLEAPVKYLEKLGYIKDKNRRLFAGMASVLDSSIGNVTKLLHQRGMLDNSIIVFTTDNGGPAAGFDMNHASNWPLRGTKAQLWEGGVRATGFVWSPLLKKSGYVAEQMINVCDWLPTILRAAGVKITGNSKKLDGVDVWESLSTNSTSPRKEILHNIDSHHGTKALRVGDFKVIQGEYDHGNWDGWYKPESLTLHGQREKHENRIVKMKQSVEFNNDLFHSDLPDMLRSMGRYRNLAPRVVVECGPRPANASTNCRPAKAPCLYNIAKDPCEFNNIAAQNPEILMSLRKRMLQYEMTAVPPRNQPEDPKGWPAESNGWAWVPWVNLTQSNNNHNNNNNV